MINFKEFAEETAARMEEAERHQEQQLQELEKFNKLMDAWALEMEARQH